MLNDDQKPMFLMSAVAAPLLHAASGCTWPAVALTGGVCLAVCLGLDAFPENTAPPAWYQWLRWLWGTVLISQILFWAENYWQERGGLWIALILLGLSVWTTAKGAAVTARCAAVSGVFLLAITGGILLSGAKEIKLQNLSPAWQLTGGNLITAFLLPSLMPRPKSGRAKARILLLAIFVSAITVGVLGTQNCWNAEAPFYELSRSLTLFGITKRFESVTAVAMTIGFYLTINFILVGSKPKNSGKTDLPALLLCTAFVLSQLKLDSRFLAAGCVLIWVFLPTLLCGINSIKKSLKTS